MIADLQQATGSSGCSLCKVTADQSEDLTKETDHDKLGLLFGDYTAALPKLVETNDLLSQVEDVEFDKELLLAMIENKGIIDKYFRYVDFIIETVSQSRKEDLLKKGDNLEALKTKAEMVNQRVTQVLKRPKNKNPNSTPQISEVEAIQDSNNEEEDDESLYI